MCDIFHVSLVLGPMAITARPDGVHDIFCVSYFFADEPRPDQMGYVTYFVFPFFWPDSNRGQFRWCVCHFSFFSFFCLMATTARPDGVHDIFCVSFFFADEGYGQTKKLTQQHNWKKCSSSPCAASVLCLCHSVHQ